MLPEGIADVKGNTGKGARDDEFPDWMRVSIMRTIDTRPVLKRANTSRDGDVEDHDEDSAEDAALLVNWMRWRVCDMSPVLDVGCMSVTIIGLSTLAGTRSDQEEGNEEHREEEECVRIEETKDETVAIVVSDG